MTRCVVCDKTVRQNEQAVDCDLCGRWTHRSCNTGITKVEYFAALKSGGSLPFICGDCQERKYRSALYADYTDDDCAQLADDIDDVCLFETGSVAQSETIDYTEMEMDLDLDSVPEKENDEEVGSDSSLSNEDLPAGHSESESVVQDETTNRLRPNRVGIELSSLDLDLLAAHSDYDDDESRPEFEIIPNGSSKGKDLLVDRLGFQYTKKPRKGCKTEYWRCVVRSSKTNCGASVIENNGTFTRGVKDHIHEPVLGGAVARRITSKVKDMAMANVFESAANITERVLTEEFRTDTSCPALPSVANIARAANHYRHSRRPKHPANLSFELKVEHIPDGFLQADISIGNQRHLIFATDFMLHALEMADTWYMDGTFKIVQAPFMQLFSIHAFVRNEDTYKQIPLCFIIMSARRTSDYKAVLTVLRQKMSRRPDVEKVVSDFEEPLWKAIEEVMPDVTHRGCAFHWSQAVWRHIQSISGLAAQYKQHGDCFRLLRLVFGLPFIPAENIVAAFSFLKAEFEIFGIGEVAEYINKTWITSRRWPPRAWSIFNQTIRTNNDIEGWHSRINRKAMHPDLNLYLLIKLLHKESIMLDINIRLMTDKKVRSVQRKNSRTNEARIQRYWAEFSRGERTVRSLLEACAFLYNSQFGKSKKVSRCKRSDTSVND